MTFSNMPTCKAVLNEKWMWGGSQILSLVFLSIIYKGPRQAPSLRVPLPVSSLDPHGELASVASWGWQRSVLPPTLDSLSPLGSGLCGDWIACSLEKWLLTHLVHWFCFLYRGNNTPAAAPPAHCLSYVPSAEGLVHG